MNQRSPAEQAHTTLRQFFFTHCAPPCGVTCVCLFCGCRWFILNVLINHITLSEKINPFPKNTSHNQHLCEAKRGGHWPFFAAFAAFDFFFASSLTPSFSPAQVSMRVSWVQGCHRGVCVGGCAVHVHVHVHVHVRVHVHVHVHVRVHVQGAPGSAVLRRLSAH